MVIIATPNDEPENNSCQPCNTVRPAVPDLTPIENAYEQNIVSEPGDDPGLALNLELGSALTNEKTAPVSTNHERPLITRQRAVTLTQGQKTTFVWQLYDEKGLPVDLSPAADDDNLKIVLRIKEQIMLGIGNKPVSVDMSFITPEIGKVSADLTSAHTAYPGVYFAEVALVTNTETPQVLLSNAFSLVITRSTFGVQKIGGPPSIAEVRLHLRDSSPAESYLLDNLMFDDAEIALAIARPVMYWNEIPPPIGEFTTQTFPFRYHWLEGICANLFMMVAEQFRRNQLDYAAAGVSVNDQNKEANYERAGQMRWQAYKDWVRAKKAEINLEGAYGEIGSLYQYGVYSSGIRARY